MPSQSHNQGHDLSAEEQIQTEIGSEYIFNVKFLNFTCYKITPFNPFHASHNFFVVFPPICLFSKVSYIANNMEPDQTAQGSYCLLPQKNLV